MVGPKPRIRVAKNPRPESATVALTTTPLASSCLVRSSVFTKAGTCVLNLVTETRLPFDSWKAVGFFS
jgi:hypothetical protein